MRLTAFSIDINKVLSIKNSKIIAELTLQQQIYFLNTLVIFFLNALNSLCNVKMLSCAINIFATRDHHVNDFFQKLKNYYKISLLKN